MNPSVLFMFLQSKCHFWMSQIVSINGKASYSYILGRYFKDNFIIIASNFLCFFRTKNERVFYSVILSVFREKYSNSEWQDCRNIYNWNGFKNFSLSCFREKLIGIWALLQIIDTIKYWSDNHLKLDIITRWENITDTVYLSWITFLIYAYW